MENPKHPVGVADAVVAEGGRRCALIAHDEIQDWYVSFSPRNGNAHAEGSWADWVTLARRIIELEAERIRSMPNAGLEPRGNRVGSEPLLGGTSLSARDCYVIGLFCDEVERMAERNMLKTGKMEGAHYAAMRQLRATFPTPNNGVTGVTTAGRNVP